MSLNHEINEVNRRLVRGEFLCSVTAPKVVESLKQSGFREDVETGLGYLGLKLVASEYDDYFYAAYDDLDVSKDLSSIKQEIQEAFKKIEPFLAFMKLISEALGTEQYPDIDHRFYFGEVLSIIESNEALSEGLRKLSTKLIFKRAGKKLTLSDRLGEIIRVMEREGIVICANGDERTLFVYTGKVPYLLDLIEKTIEAKGLDLDSEETSSLNLEFL